MPPNAPPTYVPPRPRLDDWTTSGVHAAWLGHATVLLRLEGVTILTDPALGARIGMQVGPWVLGPRRYTPPALTVRELPPIDLVLLTHAHFDHLDTWTLGHLPREVPVVVAHGNADLVRRFRTVHTMRPGDRLQVAGITVEAFAVQHWGARMVVDRQRGWVGYELSAAASRVLWTGDTARMDLRRFAARPATLAILPIGAYDPWIASHCDPEQAWTMFRESGAARLLPVHHSTFRLSSEPWDDPIRRLRAAAERDGLGDRVIWPG